MATKSNTLKKKSNVDAEALKNKQLTAIETLDFMGKVGDTAYMEALYRFRDHYLAEDEAQRLALEAFKLITNGTPPEFPKAWARQSVINNSIDAWRRRRALAERTRLEITKLMRADGSDEEEYRRIAWESAVGSMDSLSEAEKNIVIGIAVGAYTSLSQAAKSHGITGRNIAKLRQRLREVLSSTEMLNGEETA